MSINPDPNLEIHYLEGPYIVEHGRDGTATGVAIELKPHQYSEMQLCDAQTALIYSHGVSAVWFEPQRFHTTLYTLEPIDAVYSALRRNEIPVDSSQFVRNISSVYQELDDLSDLGYSFELSTVGFNIYGANLDQIGVELTPTELLIQIREYIHCVIAEFLQGYGTSAGALGLYQDLNDRYGSYTPHIVLGKVAGRSDLVGLKEGLPPSIFFDRLKPTHLLRSRVYKPNPAR